MNSPQQKVIVIDNDKEYQEVYTYFFSKYTNYALEGVYNSVNDALLAIPRIKPDIVLSEVGLKGVSGIEGIPAIRKFDPDVKVIMMSTQSDTEIIKLAFKNRANGFLTKPLTKKRLLRALNSVRFDGAAISNDVAKKVISLFQRKTYKHFSERENQIIDYLGQGATYKAIADKLFVTTSTINFHIQNIYLKLDVNSKSEALRKLRELECA